MFKRLCIFLFLVFIFSSVAFAQVKPMLTTNGVLVTSDDASDIFALSYGNTAKVVFWVVTGTGKDIKAKGIDNNANQLWETNIATAADDQEKPYACVTTNNKVVVVWQDKRNAAQSDIYAKQINPSTGTQDWETRITNKTSLEITPQVCADDSGGAYLIWHNTSGDLLYFQHLDSDGNILIGGGAGGEKYLTKYDDRERFRLITGIGGGSIVYFYKTGKNYVWQLDENGNNTASYEVTGESGDIERYENASNYLLGYRTNVGEDPSTDFIWAAKLDSGLNKVWDVQATPVGGTGTVYVPRIAIDSLGGVYLVWNYQPFDPLDPTSNLMTEMNVFAQRLTSGGNAQWGLGGEGITSEDGIQGYTLEEGARISRFPVAYNDGIVYIAWNDFRRDPSFSIDSTSYITNEADIFIKGIDISNDEGLNNPVPIASVQNAQILPEMAASFPFIFWYDGRDGSTQTIRCQRVEHIPTQITGISSIPAGATKIIGQGFGSDPSDIQDSDFTLGSDYNKVTLDGTSAEVTSWSTNEITIVATYDSLALGLHTIEVTAYGDADQLTVFPAASSFVFEEEKFGGAPYSAGGFVSENPTFEVKITNQDLAQNEIDINLVTIEVNGVASNVTQDFAADKLITDLSLSPGVSTTTYTVKVIVRNIYGHEGSKTYTVKVAAVSSSFVFEEEKFGGAPYSTGGFVNENPAFEVKITSEDQNQNKVDIEAVTIEVNGIATDVTQDFGTDRLITNLSLSQGVDTLSYTVRVIARNTLDNEGAKTYTVKVAGEEEDAIIQYLIPSEVVIDSRSGPAAAASQDIILAFNSSKNATVNLIVYTPSGQPIKIVKEASTGYNELSIDRQLFYGGNGMYIIAIYDKNNRLLAKTWITVHL
jgi:hypothetical protein